jgi:pantoate--beta-alanine ligase
VPQFTKAQVLRTFPALRRWRDQSRRKSVALVPTMGALHEGHLTLVRYARRKCDRVVVSIFVNPAQFAPNEDFGSYPRTWRTDLAALEALKVDAIWAPSVATMYPEGFSTRIAPGGPALAGLEDRFRPHFFGGVCTVVAKLLLQVRPDIATFGEKDYQQLKVVTAMARDLDTGTRIAGVPTVREKDGLAMSSRNAYLSADERAVAPMLHRALKACAASLKAGGALAASLGAAERSIENAGFAVDYLEARHAETLAPVASIKDGPVRLLVAARLGRTRLIDNIAV